MPKIPYFTISPDSFEKNAGYKSTVHALAELIDNSFEADATRVAIMLQVDANSNLHKIAVIDDGRGMRSEVLQMAICEKCGTFMDRQRSSGAKSRKKLGKYGVGLPKASISQCNMFTVWSWTEGGYAKAFKNGIDILDKGWISNGAQIDESVRESAPEEWVNAAAMDSVKSGSMVLWEDLDGLTWTRARWGKYSGLIPNLEFEVGRVYRKLLKNNSDSFSIKAIIIDRNFNVEDVYEIQPNDPLYLTKGQDIPRTDVPDDQHWPPDDPLFDKIGGGSPMNIQLPMKDGTTETVTVKWNCSTARRNTFAKLNGTPAGNLPHGKHAKRNVGLSLLREGREVSMSMALAVPSEPRERWFGVEVEIPHELDTILGMTNNKQEYTRLEKVLQHDPKDYIDTENGETSAACLERIEKEDNNLAICLRIAWNTQKVWNETKQSHKNMREENKELITKGQKIGPEKKTEKEDPESTAEKAATSADPSDSQEPKTQQEKDSLKSEFHDGLKNAGVPEHEAEQIAARIVDKGLSYAIASRRGLGSVFFNVTDIKGVKFIELNTDHPAHKYIKSSMELNDSDNPDVLKDHIALSKTAVHLMLEAWAKTELEILTDQEKRRIHRMREDWGRNLEIFINQIENNEENN